MKLTRHPKCFFFLLFIFLISHIDGNSQQLNWAFRTGSTGEDNAYYVTTDAAGNVYKSGAFSGTVDFDPGAGTFNLVSVGSVDGYVAKYTSAGAFVWAFRFGGANRDQVHNVAVDPAGNLLVTGYFRGSNVDFDPGAGTFNLTSNGDNGGDPGYGGDIFVAKYTSAGAFIFAFNIGGTDLYDSGIAIASDAANNIYVGGYFKHTADFDPGAGTAILNSAVSGPIFLAKYSPAGAYQWAFNLGMANADNTIFDLKTDPAGNVYITGFFQGINIDFDPSAATAPLSSSGGFEAFVAKYNTNGQYQFAFRIGGGATDVGRGVELDAAGNIYVLGDFTGTNIDFDPGAGTAPLSTNAGSPDVFLAKYTNTGQYVWAFRFGGTGGEYGWKVASDGSHLFITGGFSGTADMDPSANTDNLVSAGLNDIFLGKYTFNGEYLCSFKIGGAANDNGSGVIAPANNVFYLTGYFGGSNVDFDPATSNTLLSSAGNTDIFLAKYTWPDNTMPSGTITGDVVCAGEQAQLTFTSTVGVGPFIVTYNNGVNDIVQTNVTSGVPFNIIPNPGVTTTYTLVSVKDAQRCAETNFNQNSTAVVTVNDCSGQFCDSWLRLSSLPSYATVGDLDVTGNKITVEALVDRIAPLNAGTHWGHLVSKHNNASDVNYALLPNGCEITTTAGYFSAFPTCQPVTDKLYHVAMVYDGATLKFYRNGFLMAQTACTGNMINNNWLTTIGQVAAAPNLPLNQVLGYVNEVRIWNVAKTQSEIRASMSGPLLNAAAQPGLQAYYSFNNLYNKQGNPTYNATLQGAAAINQTTPLCNLIADSCERNLVEANFQVPARVCVNEAVPITNMSQNATSYYWSFCDNSFAVPPAATNLGNPGGQLVQPVFSDIVKDESGNYFVFVTNHIPGGLVRLSYGNSLLNTPVAQNLGNFGGVLPTQAEGIQVVKANGNWIGIMVGGQNATAWIVRINFGASLTNPAPVATNWGNIGNMSFPHDLYVFTENNQWHGFTVNGTNNTLTKISFGADFTAIPTAVNMGNIGVMNIPVGIGVVKSNTSWHMFVTNGGNSSLSRLDFGSSLLNTPTGVNIPNPSGSLNNPRDISLLQLCGGFTALCVNGGNQTVSQLNFGGSITSTPTGTSLGNPGGLNFPHSISELFREGSDIYAFITSVSNNSLTRLRIAGCGTPGSDLQNPASITYSQPGTYNINLMVDLGLPTQAFICKQVVVEDCSVPTCPKTQLAIGTPANDRAYDVVQSGDGYYTAGLTRAVGNDDILITKTDINGNIIWSKRFGGAGAEVVRKITAASDGGVLITGQSRSLGNPNGDILCLKVAGDGTLVWSRKFGVGSPNGDLGMEIIETSDGGYAISGIINVNGFVADALIIKLNSALNVQWTRQYDRGDGEDGVGILQKEDTLVVAVDLQNSAAHYESMVMKLRMSDGLFLSAKKLTPAARGLFNAYLYRNPNPAQPGYIISGHTIDNASYANMKHTIVTLDENFNVVKTRLIQVTPLTNDFFTGFVPLADGGFIGVASPQTNPDAYVYRINNDNSIAYAKRINASTDRRFQRITRSGQSVVAVGGVVNAGNEDFFFTSFSAANPPADWCDIENATITVEQPPYTSSNFTWPTITTPAFANTSVPLTLSDITLQRSDNPCPCNPDIIINDYTPALGFDVCKNILNVQDASRFNVGDTVLLIQMKGAVVNTTNTAAFGSVIDYRNAGNYEFNYVKAKTGNAIELLNIVERSYNFTDGKVQLIRVPYFQDYTAPAGLTCLPWDGDKGGVLVFNVQNDLTVDAGIDVSGKGFRGATGVNSSLLVTNCFTNNYFYPSGSTIAATKGESISILPAAFANGKGAVSGGGGGGLDHNSGGGGGANGGIGGFGGYQLEPCGSAPFNNRGIGGYTLPYTNATNKIFMGSGGGAGHANNPDNASQPSSGGNGGGIVIISAARMLSPSTAQIISNGRNAPGCTGPDCHDGMGGGGAGGTILLNIPQVINPTQIELKGGRGANVTGSVPAAGRIGPGGGGGGGVFWHSAAGPSGTITVDAAGGTNGVLTTDANNPWGATPGQAGINVYDLILPVDDVLFKPNIDSVRFKDSATDCNIYDFKGFGYTNRDAIVAWNWTFGDGGFANTQNASHTYSASGTFTVKLVVTDINGCKDSISRDVVSSFLDFDFSYQQDICNPLSVQFTGTGTTVSNPYWVFGDAATDNTTTTPLHLYAGYGTYTVKYSVSNGVCSDTITKVIPILIGLDNVVLTNDTTICYGTTKQLRGATALKYCWTPSTYLSDPTIQNPVTSTPHDMTYFLLTETTGSNLIVNGNFSAGNSGFTSSYVLANPNITEGQYFIGTNPQAWNGGLSNCRDHTSAGGNMMMVNGSPTPDVTVWKQTVTVTPNTNYAFSTWIQALFTPNPARLSFSINGRDLGSPITASLPTCTWTQFHATWNSGNSTTAEIAIVNKNTLVQGNDFALDDISFAEVFIKRDSVIITVDTPMVRTRVDTTICKATTIQLSATGANTYTWTPAATLSNPSIPDPVASPTGLTEYIVTGINQFGCVAKDTVNIGIHADPAITLTDDTQICGNSSIQLSITGGVSYTWTPSATLSNPTSSTPTATPTTDTWYYVDIVDNNTCNSRDSVHVTIRPEPVFAIGNSDPSVCVGQSVQLSASGGVSYDWQPSTGLNDNTIANPTATPLTTTTYTVNISEPVCNRSTTLSTTITVEVPVVTTTDNTTICKGTDIQFSTTGAQTYTWTPATTLSDPSVPNPVATPTAPTQYIVTGTTVNGCQAKDTVNISFHPDAVTTVTDDTEVCINSSINLLATGGVSYAWTPAATLNNPAIGNPQATPVQNTLYYVTITDANTCTYLDSVQVDIKERPVFALDGPGNVCINDTIQLHASGGDTYAWQSSSSISATNIPNPEVYPLVTTTYSVTITEAVCNESATLTKEVVVLALPDVQAFKANDIDCSYDRSQLSASGAQTYTWTPAASLDNPGIRNPVAMPAVETQYTVKGVDANGCANTDTVTVKFTDANKGGYLMATGFTPNGDGLNDCYGVKYWGVIEAIEFSIYNRWGERIFYTTQKGACWDGTYKGVKQDSGVFVYMIKAKTNCEKPVFRKGTFVLIR